MQLRDALSDLKEIRAQLDRTTGFRGFRSVAVGFSGILATAGAVVQLNWQTGANGNVSLIEFLVIWGAVAVCSIAAALIEMSIRSVYGSTKLVWKTHKKLAMHIAPSFFVGGILTAAVASSAQDIWLLPGIWALIYSLGLFACWQQLPRLTVWAAIYFLVGGTVCLGHCMLFRDTSSLQLTGWYMALLFGGGQFLLGWILYWTLERNHG